MKSNNAERLRMARILADMDQHEAAEALGYTGTSAFKLISNKERGDKTCSIRDALAMERIAAEAQAQMFSSTNFPDYLLATEPDGRQFVIRVRPPGFIAELVTDDETLSDIIDLNNGEYLRDFMWLQGHRPDDSKYWQTIADEVVDWMAAQDARDEADLDHHDSEVFNDGTAHERFIRDEHEKRGKKN